MINCGILPALLQLLNSPKEAIRKEACWTISNITAGNTIQIQNVIDANLVAPLIDILGRGDFKTKREACWAISNATAGSVGSNPDQIRYKKIKKQFLLIIHNRYLVNQGCIKPLCDLLTCGDPRVIQVSLDGLENILKVGEMDRAAKGEENNGMALFIEMADGLDKIHQLQLHENQDIYNKAYGIIDKYFGGDEDEGIEGDGPV